METPENLSWIAIVLAVAIIVGLFIAYQTSISAKELGQGIYVRILRSEYLSQPPFLHGDGGIYSSGSSGYSGGSFEGASGGYAIDLRIGNMESSPIVRIKFKTVGFGHGEIYLMTGENITDGYLLEDPLDPKESLELSVFIPSKYVPSGKVLVVEGLLEDGRTTSRCARVP